MYELESRNTSNRIKYALRTRAEKGFFNGSVAPYGYQNIDSKLFIRNNCTPSVIKRIFSNYINGKGIDNIAMTLYNEGVPTPSMIAQKSDDNDKWHGSTIRITPISVI